MLFSPIYYRPKNHYFFRSIIQYSTGLFLTKISFFYTKNTLEDQFFWYDFGAKRRSNFAIACTFCTKIPKSFTYLALYYRLKKKEKIWWILYCEFGAKKAQKSGRYYRVKSGVDFFGRFWLTIFFSIRFILGPGMKIKTKI